MPYCGPMGPKPVGYCGLQRYRAACLSRPQRDDKPHGLLVGDHSFTRYATALELRAFVTGREAWLEGYQEPYPDAYISAERQGLYEEGYYVEVRDAVRAVAAYCKEDKRRVSR